MSICEILCDGSKAVFVPESESEIDAIRNAISRDEPRAKGRLKLELQPRNKSGKLYDCIPISGMLSAVCVNAKARRILESLDPGISFTVLESVDCADEYSVLRVGNRMDAFIRDERVVQLPDGSLRIKRPMVAHDFLCSRFFRLPDEYENADSVYCSNEIAKSIAVSGLTGLVCFDPSTGVERKLFR